MSYPAEIKIITLYFPIKAIDGNDINEVRMREPLVRDRVAHSKDRGTEEEKEVRMLANLCNLNESDLQNMVAADYFQLQEAFEVFMLPPGKRPKPKLSEESPSSEES